ncbi:insulinase family protein [Planotetraspora kaengkrachanensis]|uniref:Insulinase family protein n=1 Tax=Planotetraspora kaengkrachanensis TaxID=575193 RepID=A0A8J3VB55_9ACTN|nr:insulinase family protein [Planotetraspora kaengkrachanensis]GIG84535.1 hypothetical protein Pka01_76620 [Planotetraspora kaengkrachanensis]
MNIERAEVDGVPVVWTPSGDKLTAGLAFRVGRADEVLARGGITHLTEHLTLYRVGQADYHYNGQVDATTTLFVTHGEADDIVSFFEVVCAALRDLPLERLPVERGILRTEEAGQSHGVIGRFLIWRYGAQKFGLPAYDQLGLDDITPDELTEWARRWFTRGNAVFWIAGGPPPEGLRLDLPDGPRMPTPVASDLLIRTPSYFPGPADGVGMHSVITRSTASAVYGKALERRLTRTLRHDRGLTYTPAIGYHPHNAHRAELVVWADGRPEQLPDLVEAFLAELDRPFTVEETSAAVDAVRAQRKEPGAEVGTVATAAWDVLHGREWRDEEDRARELDAVTADALNAVAKEAMTNALLHAPQGHPFPYQRFAAAPASSQPWVEGDRYLPTDHPVDRSHLVIGPKGISLFGPDDEWTVRFKAVAAMLSRPDGGRTLIGLDGVSVAVEPGLWRKSADLIERLDAAVPASLVVHMPAREDKEIPKPHTRWHQRAWAHVRVLTRRTIGVFTLIRLSGRPRRVAVGLLVAAALILAMILSPNHAPTVLAISLASLFGAWRSRRL